MASLQDLWLKLSRNGLRDDEGVFGHREVMFLNKILSVSPIVMLLLIPIEIAVNGFKLVPLELIFIAMMLFCFLLQRYRLFWMAKFFAVVLSQFFILTAGIMVGKGVSNHIALIPISLFGMFLFKGTRDKIIVIIITIFNYFLLFYLRDTIEPTYYLSDEVKSFFTHIFYVMTFILTFFIGYYFLSINNEYEALVVQQKEILALKNREVTDSIHYAKRIQQSLLAHTDYLKQNLPEHFVLYKPKDIVSGDFYWATKINQNNDDLFYLAVCDSTGHGVPGAFMSLLNTSYLNEAINEKNIIQTNLVFNFVRQRLIDNISKEGQKDGFDGILIRIDEKNKRVHYSAANNRPILIKNNECVELEADRMPVGAAEKINGFKQNTIEYQTGDVLYLYTDGFGDQFGGPKGKKFKHKQLNTILTEISKKSSDEQLRYLNDAFEKWKGPLEQVDDVCLIGIKF
jgi:serine phosphatase RsbU (regulator of sigma subunit)